MPDGTSHRFQNDFPESIFLPRSTECHEWSSEDRAGTWIAGYVSIQRQRHPRSRSTFKVHPPFIAMDGSPVLQSILTVAFVNSRTNTPLPPDPPFSAHTPSGVP